MAPGETELRGAVRRTSRQRGRAYPGVTLLLAASFVACASMPQEAVELSQVASRRVADTQAAHEALAAAYFRLSRERVEDFLQHQWVPTYLANFVARAKLMDELQNPVALTDSQRVRLREELTRATALRGQSLDQALGAVNSAFADSARGSIVLEFAEAALEEIEKQRRELLDPIDEQERQVRDALRANYAEMMQIQSAITGFIQSAHDVRAEQDNVLRRLNLLGARDSLVKQAITLNDAVLRLTEQGGDAEEALRQIRAKLGLRPIDAPATPPNQP